MALTPAQLELLAADIAADPVLGALEHTAVNEPTVADAYNLEASPPYYVWRMALSKREIYEANITDAPPAQTTWNWATFQSQSVQQRESWVEMLSVGEINPSLNQTRANFNTIFGGQGASLAQQNFLLALSRRRALRGEVLFTVATAGGTGPRGSVGNPDTLTLIGYLTPSDINQAWALP